MQSTDFFCELWLFSSLYLTPAKNTPVCLNGPDQIEHFQSLSEANWFLLFCSILSAAKQVVCDSLSHVSSSTTIPRFSNSTESPATTLES